MKVLLKIVDFMIIIGWLLAVGGMIAGTNNLGKPAGIALATGLGMIISAVFVAVIVSFITHGEID